MPVETVRMPTLLPRLHFDDTDKPDVVNAGGCGCDFRFEEAAPLPKLAPVLHFWPEPVEGAEFRTFAKEDVNLFFQRVGVVSRCSHILYVFPEALENLRPVVEDNHAVAGIATWSPEEPGLVAAEGRGESLAATKEIDSAGLSIVLGEDAAVMALINGDAIPGDSSFINNFFPAELVGVPLRQRGPGVRVFHDRELEGKMFCVGEEAVRRKNRHHHRSKMCATGQQDECDGGFQPLAAGVNIFTTIDRGLNHYGPSGQQHWINGSEVVVLAMEQKKDPVANQI